MNKLTGGAAKLAALILRYGAGVFVTQGAPTNGTSGTYANLADASSLLLDQTNGVFYQNTNTKASPTWTKVPNGSAGSVLTAMLAAAAVTSAKLDPSTIQTVQLSLTNAQIKALRATPITLVAAPGAGKFILPIACFVELVYGGTNAFTGAANDNLSLKWKDGSGALLMSGGVQAFIQATASAFSMMVPGAAVGSTINAAKSVVDNQALVIHNQTAGEIAGNAAADNTMNVTLQYAIQTSL